MHKVQSDSQVHWARQDHKVLLAQQDQRALKVRLALQAPRVLKVLQVLLVLLVHRVLKVLLVLQAHKVLLVSQVLEAPMVLKDHRVLLVLQAHRVRLDSQDLRVLRVHKVLSVQRVHKVLQVHKALLDSPVRSVLKVQLAVLDHRVQLVQLAHRVRLDSLDLKVLKAQRVLKVLKVLRVHKVRLVHKVLLVTLVHWVLKAQQVLIPGGVLADLVVGQDQRLALDLGQVFHGYDGHLGHAELAGSKQSAVTCDDVVLPVHQDGSTPAKLRNAGRDLCHMGVRVQLGISGVRDQGLNRPVLDFDVGLHAASETKKPAREMLLAGCWMGVAARHISRNRRQNVSEIPVKRDTLKSAFSPQQPTGTRITCIWHATTCNYLTKLPCTRFLATMYMAISHRRWAVRGAQPKRLPMSYQR